MGKSLLALGMIDDRTKKAADEPPDVSTYYAYLTVIESGSRLTYGLSLQDTSETVGLLRDARIFVLASRETIGDYPLQVYHSAIVFAPEASTVKKIFKHHSPAWMSVSPNMDREWEECPHSIGTTLKSEMLFLLDSKWLAYGFRGKFRVHDLVLGTKVMALGSNTDALAIPTFINHEICVSRGFDWQVWSTGSNCCSQQKPIVL